MNISLLPFGSAGDVLPFIWLARQLRARGHQPTLITASLFQKAADDAGIPFVPIGSDEEFAALMRDPRIWKLGAGTQAVFEFATLSAGRFYDAVTRELDGAQRPDLLLAPVTAFGARLARERWGLPLVTVHLQPAVLLSAHETPVLLPAVHWLVRRLPSFCKRWIFRHGPNPLDFFGGAALRRLCVLHDVTPPRRFFTEWWDSPDGSLILFPEWFAAPQVDWPKPRLQWSFPLEDLAAEQSLAPALTAFLERHRERPPVVFTAGSANVQAADFFAVAVAALRLLDRPGVLVTRDLSQLPADLPPTVHAVEYVPFGPLLAKAAAFVHHGGIGTLSQGFAAGVPQLVMPLAHDQPDNADRLRRIGAGDFLRKRRFTARNVAAALQRLLTDPVVADRCAKLALRLRHERQHQPARRVMEWLEQRARKAHF